MKEGEDYYINKDRYWVLTEIYHLKRGYCCNSGCLHCPWKVGETEDVNKSDKK